MLCDFIVCMRTHQGLQVEVFWPRARVLKVLSLHQPQHIPQHADYWLTALPWGKMLIVGVSLQIKGNSHVTFSSVFAGTFFGKLPNGKKKQKSHISLKIFLSSGGSKTFFIIHCIVWIFHLNYTKGRKVIYFHILSSHLKDPFRTRVMSVLPKFLVLAFKMKKPVITITLQPDNIWKRLSCLSPAFLLYHCILLATGKPNATLIVMHI